ncbi:MAG: GTP-binding protein [Pseudomonadota bacterium]
MDISYTGQNYVNRFNWAIVLSEGSEYCGSVQNSLCKKMPFCELRFLMITEGGLSPMTDEKDMINAVPTNIITGSLGAGKTTLIQSLLKQKPSNQRWAVLVNEFGEVGIDNAIIDGAMTSPTEKTGIFVKEVPGGCMCCTSGLPMQIALNLLLQEAKPDRLLIEPTGLGHPTEVLAALSAPHYRSVLKLQATFTLIDAAKLSSKKWAEHPTFQEQIRIADVIVKTKTQAYTTDDAKRLNKYLDSLNVKHIPIIDASSKSISMSELAKPNAFLIGQQNYHKHAHVSHDHDHQHDRQQRKDRTLEIETQVLAQPIIKIANHGEGFFSFGWICAPDRHFDVKVASKVFESLEVERLKAVLLTEDGAASFNLSANQLSIDHSNYRNDSRLEFICASKQEADHACQIIEKGLTLYT